MPETNKIVINTGPLLALIAGLGDLKILNSLYEQVVVPYEGKDTFSFYMRQSIK